MNIFVSSTQLVGENTLPVFCVVIIDDDDQKVRFHRTSQQDAEALCSRLKSAFNGKSSAAPVDTPKGA